MKVILANHAGFCMGVRRAVETTLDTVQREDREIATFGPLIHNPQVLDILSERGVKVLDNVPEHHSGTVIIRAHGVPPAKKQKLEESGAIVKDATCPRVVKVQVIIDKYSKKGHQTVIIGDKNHAEVEGLMGYAGPTVQVVSNENDIAGLELTGPYIIVSQTTQDENSFEQLSRLILEKFPRGKVFNTICDSTHKRQEEVRELCRKVQAMVVVGGRSSANTARLGEIARGMGVDVFMVESEDDLDIGSLSKYECVGVTAGASTPSWMINWIVRVLESVPSEQDSVFKAWLHKIFWLLLATNLYVSIAGGMMSVSAVYLMGIPFKINYFLIAVGYIFAMHNLNRFSDQRSKKINDPLRAMFYKRYRWPLLVASIVTLLIALKLSDDLGSMPFFLLCIMSLLGILYSVRIIPKFISPFTKIRGLKEIPGSKTFFVALAWAFVTVLIPVLAAISSPTVEGYAVFIYVLLLVFVRNALFDVFEVQGDRIVGKETLPVFIGEKKTLLILYYLLGFMCLLLFAAPAAGLMTPAGYLQIPAILILALIAYLYSREQLKPGLVLEFFLESIFFICAGLAWIAGSMIVA